ncbi:MAG: hypothetical protein VYB74_01755, partial [Cyanobacteriota bacterium]|nr:hypothetical protein [Cyanobacteriota bacterium]
MQRFSASAASSSTGRAEQPATASTSSGRAEHRATSLRSAEPPAILLQRSLATKHPTISSIGDVHRWLAEEHVASCTNTDAQRIREAVDVLRSASALSQKQVEPLRSKWQVQRLRCKKRRPLPDVIQDLTSKVVEAAQELQRQLAGSAGQPASTSLASDMADVSSFGEASMLLARSAAQPASSSAAQPPSAGEDSVFANLRDRQQKRATQVAQEEERPSAKAKVGRRESKRIQSAETCGVERPAPAKKGRRTPKESFAACAAPPTELDGFEAASSSSAAQPAQQRNQKRLWKELQEWKELQSPHSNAPRMFRLWKELQKLDEGWVVGEAADEIKRLIEQTQLLSKAQLTQED